MRNVTASIKGKKLVIECDLSGKPESFPLSASKKTRLVATSNGNTEIENDVLPGLKLGLNLYIKADGDA